MVSWACPMQQVTDGRSPDSMQFHVAAPSITPRSQSSYLSDATFLASHSTLAATKSRYRQAIDGTRDHIGDMLGLRKKKRPDAPSKLRHTQRGVATNHGAPIIVTALPNQRQIALVSATSNGDLRRHPCVEIQVPTQQQLRSSLCHEIRVVPSLPDTKEV